MDEQKPTQCDRFIETARKIGADDDEATFLKKLAVIARQKPKEPEPSDAVILDSLKQSAAGFKEQAAKARKAVQESREVIEQAGEVMKGKCP